MSLLSRTPATAAVSGPCVACGQTASPDRGGVLLHPQCARQINDTVARETAPRRAGGR